MWSRLFFINIYFFPTSHVCHHHHYVSGIKWTKCEKNVDVIFLWGWCSLYGFEGYRVFLSQLNWGRHKRRGWLKCWNNGGVFKGVTWRDVMRWKKMTTTWEEQLDSVVCVQSVVNSIDWLWCDGWSSWLVLTLGWYDDANCFLRRKQ